MNTVIESSPTLSSPGLGSTALLHLMHLVSPALPVGAYAYSQGLEYAIDGGWLKTPEQVQSWVEGLLNHALTTLDLPVLKRSLKAWQEKSLKHVEYWDDFIRANRETQELLLEDEQLGMALNRLLIQLGASEAEAFEGQSTAFVTQFALACSHWQIPEQEALYGLAYSWLENQIAAATKLVPLGQTAAQKMLLAIVPSIPSACGKALSLSDDALGLSFPGLALASSLHERQYSRLFRS